MSKSIEGTGKKPRKRRRVLSIIFIAVAITLLITAIDSRNRIVTNEYEVFSGNLPAAFDGFRIVQISDLHGETFGAKNRRLLETVRAARPDIIALTGDFVEKADEIPKFRELCAALTDIASVYFVSGNHDWVSGKIEKVADALALAGVSYLRNEYVGLTRGEATILLCGVEDPNGYADMKTPPEVVALLRESHERDFTVLLGHRNYWLERYPALDVDVILSGHAHGGLVRLPFMDGLFGTRDHFLPKYTSGPYQGERYTMVVSRGLGNTVPVPRLFNNAHLPVIILRKR